MREGTEALQRGDIAVARSRLAQAADRPDGGSALLPLAHAHRLAGDTSEEEAVLDRLLEREPRHLMALILRGRAREAAGDDRAATAFYQSALANAGASPPAQLVAELHRIRTWLAGAGQRYEAHLRRALADAGLGRAERLPRLAYALDLLTGRSEIYPQQPTSFYFPGLPQRFFYERDEFDWVAAFESAAGSIRAELAELLVENLDFPPYIENDPTRPQSLSPLRDSHDWGAFHLMRGGEPVVENVARCPATMAALGTVPAPRIAGRGPDAMFSLLKPRTHIAPHNGMLNTRLICHLPLIVPDGCRLRVGAETRVWEQDRLLLFDDSIEHEAWNGSDRNRVILLFDIWRPEISAEERAALTILFEAIGRY